MKVGVKITFYTKSWDTVSSKQNRKNYYFYLNLVALLPYS